MNNVINRSALKKFILKQLNSKRPHLNITRVSSNALDSYEIRLKAMVIDDIATHPSVGKTFNPEKGI